ncbi:MAG: hypothetical protein M1517_02205 [Deltaproteobacteria bacterium]|nr:hypothetical protein [Deltaproteobacteria bacterium]
MRRLPLLSLVALLAIAASATARSDRTQQIQLSTAESAPELRWRPMPEVLDKAFSATLMTTDVTTNIRRGIKTCEDYITTHPDDTQGRANAYVIMAQAYFNLGEYSAPYDEKIKDYTAGEGAAQHVIDLVPGTWAGWAWYAINLGRISQMKGVLKSLFLLGPFRRHVFRAEKLAPNSAFVLDAIGIMYRQVPWIAGGDIGKSEKYLEKSVEVDPGYTLGELDLAITLLEEGKDDRAQTMLLHVINAREPSWKAHWQIWERPKAEALSKDMGGYKKLLDEWHMLR